MTSPSDEHAKIFQPAKIAQPNSGSLISQATVSLDKDLQSYAKDYHFAFVNTLHMYLRIPINLFELYTSEFNTKLEILNFELPGPLLVEDVEIPAEFIPPEPGWSRYLHGIPHEQWDGFKNWLVNAKWMSKTKNGDQILYGCEEELVQVRDPVKLQTMQIVGIKEFVNISFFVPANSNSKLYINLKNGPPFNCVYVARNGPGGGEAMELFKKLREIS
jgi:hypothetical protein